MRLNDFKFLQLAQEGWTINREIQRELCRVFTVDGNRIFVTVTRSGDRLHCSCRIGSGPEFSKNFKLSDPLFYPGYTSGFAPMFIGADEAIDAVVADSYLDTGENFVTECNQVISQRLKTAGASKGVGYFFLPKAKAEYAERNRQMNLIEWEIKELCAHKPLR